MILTGQINLTAAEALTAGLASRVVAPRRATRRSTEPGRHDRRQFEYGRAHGQEAVNRVYESRLSEGLLYERRLFYSSLATADKAECSRAFIDKRQPRFTGRQSCFTGRRTRRLASGGLDLVTCELGAAERGVETVEFE